mmetsp:Transcript_63961/g.133346  ORF Transcript_63961/g.133346 Transcript_63961/m.133346 type:complete len:325 (-) Transcript_63961:7-981(-)
MVPALQGGVKMKQAGEQGYHIREIQTFAMRLINEPEFAMQLITEHIVPVTYLDHDGRPPSWVDLSDGQALAYKRLCQRNSSDDLTVQFIGTAASYICMKQINMSQELLNENDGEERHYKAKRANNKGDERTFGYKDWIEHIAPRINGARLDGIVMQTINGTMEWLEEKGEDEQRRLLKANSNYKVTAGMKEHHDKRIGLCADAAAKKQDGAAIEKGRMALANRKEKRALIEGAEIWLLPDIDAKFAGATGTSKELIDGMKLQWKWWQKQAVENGEKARSFPNLIVSDGDEVINQQSKQKRAGRERAMPIQCQEGTVGSALWGEC